MDGSAIVTIHSCGMYGAAVIIRFKINDVVINGCILFSVYINGVFPTGELMGT